MLPKWLNCSLKARTENGMTTKACNLFQYLTTRTENALILRRKTAWPLRYYVCICPLNEERKQTGPGQFHL